MISDRKQRILQVVIDDYISSASPVSSKAVHDSYLDHLSPATIRNEMATLEEMGFLTHPHTSAGRIPTNLAYKHYIDNIIDNSKMSVEELDNMKKYFDTNIKEAQYIASNAVKLLSEMTNYTSVAIINKGSERLQSIKLIKLSENVLLLIIVSESGKVEDYKIYGNFNEGEDYIKTAEQVLNKHIAGKKLSQLSELGTDVQNEFEAYKGLFDNIFNALRQQRTKTDKDLYLMGGTKIFDQPEYNNVESVKDFISVIDSKEKLTEMLNTNSSHSIDVSVTLGGEVENLPKDCSLVSANYVIGGVDFGTYGVIGPTRMDYNNVIKVLNGIRDILIDIIDNDK